MTLGLLVFSGRALAQQKERVWRVGILAPGRRPEIYSAFTAGLRDLGYIEGQNLEVTMKVADGHYERLADLAAELVRLPVDVIITDATPGALAAMKATKTIPIVFQLGDPVGNGVVKSLARPGGNATGLSVFTKEMSAKQMEMLVAAMPRMSKVAVLWNPANSSHLPHVDGLRKAAIASKLSLLPVEARTQQEIETAVQLMTKERVEGFVWLADPFFNQQARQIAELAVRRRLLSIGVNPAYAEAGGLMTYGADPKANYRHLASTVDKIFRGASPGDLPVEQPTKIEFVINRKTAKALGLTIPPELLLLADRVIE